MKTATIATLLLALGAASSGSAQNCKPDYSTQDRITKDQTDVWSQELFKTGFGRSLVGTSELSVIGIIGRYGATNAFNLQIVKQEESKQKAVLESQLSGKEGNAFSLGLKGGKPLTFVVSDVSNETKTGFMGKLVTTVVLSSELSDEAVIALREALTRTPIDALRVQLVGSVLIDESVNAKNGEKMMAKFNCYYAAMASRPPVAPALRLLAVDADSLARRAYAAFAPVVFRRVGGAGGDFFSFTPLGTFAVSQDGRTFGGRYRLHADSITYQVIQGQQHAPAFTAPLGADRFVDDEGIVWEKVSGTKQTTAPQLTIDQILRMVAAKLPDDVIIRSIRNAGAKFDVTPEVLIKLKAAGVSDAILREMMR